MRRRGVRREGRVLGGYECEGGEGVRMWKV